MGYKMPIVCKEIYLPYDVNDESLTFEEYKEKFGIDLYDIFTIDDYKEAEFDPTYFGPKDGYVKLYVVPIGYDANLSFVTILSEIYQESAHHMGLVFQGSHDGSSFTLVFNLDTNTIGRGEI